MTALSVRKFFIYSVTAILFFRWSSSLTFAQTHPVYPPLPTGYGNKCVLAFQQPNFPAKCAACIMSYRIELKRLYQLNKHNRCTETEIINHFCNGGLGPQAKADCNALKNSICNVPPDYLCTFPTQPIGPATRTPTPPATRLNCFNPRGCGILYTAGVPSCWCNSGGGQGLCGNLSLDGPGGCRDLCERGIFTGPAGYTHCFIMTNGEECRSNDDGTYRFCQNKCLAANPGFIQTIGCEYPNKTVFGKPAFNLACVLAHGSSANNSFLKISENFFKKFIGIGDIINYVSNLVRVPGAQKVICNPKIENCNFE